MSEAMGWWIAAAVVVLAEVATGTFYLLMVSFGLIGGALAAHAGLPFAGQCIAAALLGGLAVVVWHQRRGKVASPPPGANHDLLLDIGQHVRVTRWGSDGRTHVHYRGADWQARWGGDGAPEPGEHVILALDGNELVLGH